MCYKSKSIWKFLNVSAVKKDYVQRIERDYLFGLWKRELDY